MRVTLATITVILTIASPSLAQEGSPTAIDMPKPLTFDVISVKPDKSGGGTMLQMTPDGFTMANMPIDTLLTQGFQVNPNQIVDEPGWAKTDKWDIQAKVAPEDVAALGKMSFDQRRAMFVRVLTDRFGLTVQHGTRELPVYALVVAKGGLKMMESKPDPNAPPKGAPPKMRGDDGKISGQGVSMEFLASVLSRIVGRTVVDRTGLTTQYDFALHWTPEGGAAAVGPGAGGSTSDGGATQPVSDAGSGESIFTAIPEQLGLKLEPAKAPVDVIVIGHLEKPTEN
jgi:uncharacterized protein (TIGR03435 family)